VIDKQLSHYLLIVAAILGASGVAVGAFGAHGLGDLLSARELEAETVTKRLGQFEVGTRYQMYHALAVMVLASLPLGTSRARNVIAIMFVLGTILFSGSLYLLVLTNTPWLGAVTPIGGLIWIFAWLSLGILARKSRAGYKASNDSRSA
jgi:uncharacterized membrane protein YgdD (TMEM256/DUF423 family)